MGFFSLYSLFGILGSLCLDSYFLMMKEGIIVRRRRMIYAKMSAARYFNLCIGICYLFCVLGIYLDCLLLFCFIFGEVDCRLLLDLD